MEYEKILRMAIESEVEAYEFYKDAAAKVTDAVLKDTFEELAEEEVDHKLLLEGYLADKGRKMNFKAPDDYKVSETVELQTLSTDIAFKDAIALAMKKEQEAMELYRSFADMSETAEQKEAFLQLATMEQGHKSRLEDIYTNAAFAEAW
ncbi:MAG: ferritin family protein [Synergistaceae bacterium]|nr:ferritin family protein [Synergistota bacterium]NLM71571.1 ferritin family protein [Synergistaceae bacterium]